MIGKLREMAVPAVDVRDCDVFRVVTMLTGARERWHLKGWGAVRFDWELRVPCQISKL